MKLVRDVLIGFVTTSDPGSERGPANIITVAKAKLPQVIYLLYTDTTQANRDALHEWLRADRELAEVEVRDLKLDLPDVTDYGRLATLLPEELKKISKSHPGAHFHLVSGLAQARIIFALCLHSQLLTGTLWEVNPPEPPKPRPYKAPPPRELDRQACEQRLERWPTAIFDAFREKFLERYRAIRLRIDLPARQAWLDNRRLDLRAAAPRRGEGDTPQPRTFGLLVLLAAKKLYGGGDDIVPKALIKETAYSDQKAHAPINIRRAIHSINRQARRLTEGAAKPLDPLIVDVKRGGRPIGCYRLTNRLNPPDETIEFVGDLRQFLEQIGVKLSSPGARSMFPNLP